MSRAAARAAAVSLLIALASCVSPPAPPPLPRPTPDLPDAPAPPLAAPPPAAPSAELRLEGRVEQGGLVRGFAAAGSTVTLDSRPLPVAPDGAFLIGFLRDNPPSATLLVREPDGRTVTRQLAVANRAWDIQSLPTLPKGTPTTPEQQARRKAELEQIAAARANDTGSEGWRQAMHWPVTGPISGVFGSQRIYAGEPGDPHAGVDVARPVGTPVASPADGVVVLAAEKPFSLEGNLLIIDHGMGLNSAFLHLSKIDVKVGDRVAQGQRVGAIGQTGRATGPHLHWAMKLGAIRIDPQPLAGPMPAR